MSSTSCRIWSASAKSFAFFAATRCSTSALTSSGVASKSLRRSPSTSVIVPSAFSPASIASRALSAVKDEFMSRTCSKIAASASAVFKSSDIAASNASTAFLARSANVCSSAFIARSGACSRLNSAVLRAV